MVFEHAVAEFRFAFWQYFDEAFCEQIPADPATASDDQLAYILDIVSGPEILGSDESLADFGAYYYQAAAQLGSYGPLSLERHLKSRLQYPGTYRVERYSTYPITKVDPFAMFDIQLWLATQGKRVMLIYGENDPWTAGAYHLGIAQDAYRYDVPAGNHGAFIGQLPEAQQSAALETLARWADAPLAPAALVDDHARGAVQSDWQEDRTRRTPL